MQEDIFERLFSVIEERKNADPSSSYIARLYAKGLPKLTGKFIEEAGETVVAAYEDDKEHFVYELCDALFHAFVLAGYKSVTLADITNELTRRFGVSGLDEKANRGTS